MCKRDGGTFFSISKESDRERKRIKERNSSRERKTWGERAREEEKQKRKRVGGKSIKPRSTGVCCVRKIRVGPSIIIVPRLIIASHPFLSTPLWMVVHQWKELQDSWDLLLLFITLRVRPTVRGEKHGAKQTGRDFLFPPCPSSIYIVTPSTALPSGRFVRHHHPLPRVDAIVGSK